MVEKKLDLRVRRTRDGIKNAFYTLMAEKGYSKITIQEIADGAYINRNTFYLHYIDKDDLLDKLTEESLKKLELGLQNSVSTPLDKLTYEAFKEIVKSTFTAIEKDIDYYEMIFGKEELPYLNTKLEHVIRNHISLGQTSVNHNKEAYFYIDYLTVGLVGSIKFWVRNRQDYTIEEMSTLLINMYSSDVLKLMG